MNRLLKRQYFVSTVRDLKLRNKKPWRTPQLLNDSMLFLDQTSQELVPASALYKFCTTLPYSTRKLFNKFIGCVSIFSKPNSVGLPLPANQFERPLPLGSKDMTKIHFSSASFHELHSGHNIENCLQPGISDKHNILNAQVGSFLEKLQNCTSVDEILTLTELAVCMKTLHVDCLSVLLSNYREHVYKTFSFPWLFSELHLKKVQLKWNFLVDLISPYTTDSRFQNLISYAETLVDEIPINDCLQILYNLDYLFMDRTNSSFACKICDKCSENLSTFNLNQLAIFSSFLQSFPKDYVLHSKISNAAKIWLMTHTSTDIDLEDLCTVFENNKLVVSTDMFELGAKAIIDKLANDPSRVTLAMISKIGLYAKISYNECYESLVNGVLDLPLQCFNVDIANSLTFDICCNIGGSQLLCPIIKKLRAHCVSELNSADHLSMHDMIAYSLLLIYHKTSITQKKRELFVQFVEESDNFLLYQLMLFHAKTPFKELPESRELALAYHQRLVKLFASLSENQQKNLLSQNRGYFGKILFELVNKLKASNIQVNRDLLHTIDNLFLLKSNEWDALPLHIITCALSAIDRMVSGTLLARDDLSVLTKHLSRLDFIYHMKLYTKFDMLCILPHISQAAKQQCFVLRKSLLESFESKISRTATLVPSFSSNKILPLPKKQMHWKTAGADIYDRLRNNLPRFLKNQDDKTCQRALRLLATGVERYPIYQKETFETLISFVTSSSKLLIYPGIDLVKILAHSGYQPDAYENFATWSQQLASSIMEHGMLDKSTLVHLAYHLSLLGIFHDTLLLKIFSLNFMTALDQELEGDYGDEYTKIEAEKVSRNSKTTIHVPNKVKYELALLSRSVAIECPHLAVPWFSRSFLLNDSKSESTNLVNKVTESVCRLVGDTNYVVLSAESPYAHHIDALLYFDPGSGIIRPDDVQSGQPLPDIEKVAVLYLQQCHNYYDGDILNGKCQADIRQLQMLGYTVVLFTQKELSSMEFQFEDNLDNYVRTKINSSVRAEVFSNLQQ